MAIAHPAVPELDILPVLAVLLSRRQWQRQDVRCKGQEAKASCEGKMQEVKGQEDEGKRRTHLQTASRGC